MKRIVVRLGDVITIKGGRGTVAIVDRAYPADAGVGIIRIDRVVRRNAKTRTGRIVTVEKVDVKEARKVVVAPPTTYPKTA